MTPLKRVAAIHDLSGFGKCSLTVAMPIISAAGIEVCSMPTAILSTHTGGFSGFTFRDLTEDLLPFGEHWHSLNLDFAAIYTGFLGSPEQIAIVAELFEKLKSQDTLIMVDPVMADNGKLYDIFDQNMSDNMAKLAVKADLLVPNMTEAALILHEDYQEAPYTEEYIRHIATSLAALGPQKIVLTGVALDAEHLGAASYDKATDTLAFAVCPQVPGYFHGTGDVFGSFLLAALLNEKNLPEATQFAVEYTYKAIKRTEKRATPAREGVDFEGTLPEMMVELNLLEKSQQLFAK